MIEQLIAQQIAEQNALLNQLIGLLQDKQELGFCESPRPKHVYCNRSNPGMLWYTLDENRLPKAIPQTALTCIVERIEFKKMERRGKEVWKTHLHVKADRPYILESGYDSHFSKGLISALATMSHRWLQQPITIEVQPAESEEVLFCRVYAQGEQVFAPYDENTDWRKAARMAIANVDLANGREPQAE